MRVAMKFLVSVLLLLLYSASAHAADPKDAATAKPKILTLEAGSKGPKRLSGKFPRFTHEAKKARATDDVLMEVCTTAKGEVSKTDSKVMKEAPYGLTEAAISAVAGWKYEPYLVDGKATPVCFPVTIKFVVK